MNRPKPVVGQEMFLVERGSSVHETSERDRGRVVVVSKVGRKYFHLKELPNKFGREDELSARFFINSWRQDTEYSPRFSLYENEEEYLAIRRDSELRGAVRERFRWTSAKDITSEQITAIAEILKIEVS